MTCPGPDNFGQKSTKTCPYYNVTTKPKTKLFLKILTRRLRESIDGLNSSLAQSAAELMAGQN